MDHKGRLAGARMALDKSRLDALVITHLPNVHYLCGFTGSAGALVIGKRDSVLFTDGRYTQQARAEVKSATVEIIRKSALTAAGDWLASQASLRRIGIEPAHVTVAERNVLSKAVRRGSKLVEAPPIVEQMRMIKDAEEIGRIRGACGLGNDLFAVLLDCGVRIGEALGLRHEDMGIAERTVTVMPRRNDNGARAKAGISRTIPASAELMRLYADYLTREYGSLDSDYVFVNLWSQPYGRPWAYAAVYDLVLRLRERTGIDFGPHQYRHTYATWLLRKRPRRRQTP